jgi:hypothetical protein
MCWWRNYSSYALCIGDNLLHQLRVSGHVKNEKYKKMKAFISYNHSDKDYVKTIRDILEKNGIKYYIDEKFEYGEDIKTSVHNSLNDCTHIFVVVSPGSLKSHWVPYEIGYAHGLKEVRVIPLLTHPSLDVYSFISNLKYITDFDEFEKFVISSKDVFKKLPLNYEIEYDLCEEIKYDEKIFLAKPSSEIMTKSYIYEKNMAPHIKLKLMNFTDKNINVEEVFLEFGDGTGFSKLPSKFKVESMNAEEVSFFLKNAGNLHFLTSAYNVGIKRIKIKDLLNREISIEEEFKSINKNIQEVYTDFFHKK